MTGRGNLKSLAPLLYSQFDSWETGYEENHAKEFTRAQLAKYHETCPTNNVNHELYKTYSVVAVSYGSRSGEPILLHFGFDGCNASKKISYITRQDHNLFIFLMFLLFILKLFFFYIYKERRWILYDNL